MDDDATTTLEDDLEVDVAFDADDDDDAGLLVLDDDAGLLVLELETTTVNEECAGTELELVTDTEDVAFLLDEADAEAEDDDDEADTELEVVLT